MKKLILMVGLPRSGKTTKAHEISRSNNAPIVNPDAIRLAIHGQAYIQEAEPFVWAVAHAMVDALFIAGYAAVILDACNNTKKRRDEWRRGGCWAIREFVVMETPKDVCLERNTDKTMVHVIERMAEQHEPVQDDER